MGMLEKMARRLAQDALERVQPGIYTSVVDGVCLYRMLDGNYQVGERLGAGDEDAPGISFETARESMVAMMVEQAGALVVVPEDAPMDSRLLQIADMLVNSADVPTGPQDVADGTAIVQTVKQALDWLAKARAANAEKSSELRDALAKVQHSNADFAAASNQANNLQAALDLCREQLYAAQQEIGALTAKLEAAQRTNVSYSGQLEGWQGRYEGLSEALSMAMDKLAAVR
jgi:hypothetical protein